MLVATFAPVERIPGYREQLGLTYEVASDPERLAYRAYGLERGSTWQVWHPRVWLRYARLLAAGKRLSLPTGRDDIHQLGGDFVIDSEGRLVFEHRSHRPDDRPTVSRLLGAVADHGTGSQTSVT